MPPALVVHHERIRRRGVNPLVYRVTRAVLQPLIQIYFRLARLGREHVPADGPLILAANHRSFLDPFLIGCCVRRPIYFLAKQELFRPRLQGWFLNALGAFPVRRGESDEEAIETAKAVLARGGVVVVFPEGTRIRTGSLGTPKRGVGRLALETGAPVVPVAVTGSERARRGFVIRPVKVKVRVGRPLTFPRVASATPRVASEVTARIWPCVELQWEWLGGLPPLRKAAVIGAGAMGTGIASVLARAGLDVQLGARTRERADSLAATETLPERVAVTRAAEIELGAVDLVVLAVPAAALPVAVAQVGDRVSSRSGVLVLSKGVVAPLGALPASYVAERVGARAIAALGGPCHAGEAAASGASVVVASRDADFAGQLSDALARADINVATSRDLTGVQFAGCAKNAAALAGAAAATSGMNAAGAAAAAVFAELERLARARGAERETFLGLAGVGDLVATVLAPHSRNRRAGELLAAGTPATDVASAVGATAEAVSSLPLLVELCRAHGVDAPATSALAALAGGRLDPQRWIAGVRSGAHAA